MSRLRNRKQHRSVSFQPLNDARLSWKARGIMAYLESRPDNWDFSIAGLKAVSDSDGATSLNSGLDELKQAGYLSIERDGLDWVWTLFPDTDHRYIENPSIVEQPLIRVLEGKSNRKKETTMSDNESDVFGELWKANPRGSKKKARIAFGKALRTTELDTIRTAYLKYVTWVRSRDGFDGAHFVTWLNGERWDEEIEVKPNPSARRHTLV